MGPMTDPVPILHLTPIILIPGSPAAKSAGIRNVPVRAYRLF
jgi:hypothetical protein